MTYVGGDALEKKGRSREAVHKGGKGVSALVPECSQKDVIRRQNGRFYMLAESIGSRLERVEDPHYLICFGFSS